jgi:hypothetical protein
MQGQCLRQLASPFFDYRRTAYTAALKSSPGNLVVNLDTSKVEHVKSTDIELKTMSE